MPEDGPVAVDAERHGLADLSRRILERDVLGPEVVGPHLGAGAAGGADLATIRTPSAGVEVVREDCLLRVLADERDVIFPRRHPDSLLVHPRLDADGAAPAVAERDRIHRILDGAEVAAAVRGDDQRPRIFRGSLGRDLGAGRDDRDDDPDRPTNAADASSGPPE